MYINFQQIISNLTEICEITFKYIMNILNLIEISVSQPPLGSPGPLGLGPSLDAIGPYRPVLQENPLKRWYTTRPKCSVTGTPRSIHVHHHDKVTTMCKLQFHIIGRADDLSNIETPDLREHSKFGDFALQTKVSWSKNVLEES